jgi:hypothetical protein
MAERRTSRLAAGGRKPMRKGKRSEDSPLRRYSAIIGGGLIVLALLWFVWLLIRQVNPAVNSITFPFVSNPTSKPSDPLTAAGVTLTPPNQGQQPALTKPQALLLADQLEPAAAQAGGVDAQYTLFSYSSSGIDQTNFHNVPIWLIHYSKVTEPQPDTSADPHASSGSHDFYVFLDANSGQELLTIWS